VHEQFFIKEVVALIDEGAGERLHLRQMIFCLASVESLFVE
jgi:hypothetical protein